jgi:predicted amidohydrolase YtcJ
VEEILPVESTRPGEAHPTKALAKAARSSAPDVSGRCPIPGRHGSWRRLHLSGFSLHDELALFVQAGLTPGEALKTATYNPAKFLGMLDQLGTVEKGKLADLVLLDANPLEDIHNTQKIRL